MAIEKGDYSELLILNLCHLKTEILNLNNITMQVSHVGNETLTFDLVLQY